MSAKNRLRGPGANQLTVDEHGGPNSVFSILPVWVPPLQQQFAGASQIEESLGLVGLGTGVLDSPEFFGDAQRDD